MCNATMNARMQELAKLRTMREELEELISHEEHELRQYMLDNELEELIGEEHKATLKQITSSRLDSSALKKELPEIAARFMKTSSCTRFTFA